MATFRKRGDYQWQAIVRKAGFDPVYATFDTKKEAETWAMETELSMGKNRYTNKDDVPTMAVALEKYLAEVTPHKSLHSQKSELKFARVISQSPLGTKKLSDITPNLVITWAMSLHTEKGNSGNTIRLYCALISNLYTIARDTWRMRDLDNPIPAAKSSLPRASTGRERRLDKDAGECGLLMALLPYPYSHMAALALETAMRREEIFEITVEHVHIAERFIHLPKTKDPRQRRSKRNVPLSPAAIEIVEDVLRHLENQSELRQQTMKARPHQPMGNKRTESTATSVTETADYRKKRIWSSPETLDAITQMFGKYTAETICGDLTFHDLRHEAVSRLFENTDLDAMEIARISGHKTWSQLSRYSHLRADRLADRLAGKKR
ncbi:tyrosine-type recombinase/integrase [Acidithiobacillus ferrooxidans]|jgi:integrase|uniref:tyrosine-type recombinase/integrase n=1 Tax=Acidithiobacillus ferrooxidans TaxID=920 RepID=UPI001C06DFD8|nr:tyrosine-type recombinase/integrase [Acidithiobacillus ferrooxidans]MBU2858622.1 tyrosine-type recombinase/integrase [Acidithiobacillus ferrooxidans]